MKKPSNEIVTYVDEHVFPVYEQKIAYKRDHIDYVIRRSLEFANQVSVDDNGKPINIDMVYVIAAYHDIGEIDNRKTHELVGAKMLRDDMLLQKFFTLTQIETMAQSVEDHRASGKSEPRTIYGRIVSSADRITSMDDMFALGYGFCARRGVPLSDIIENVYFHLCEKYGEHGYALSKIYFKDQEYESFIAEALQLSKDKVAFTKRFLQANGLEAGT